MQLRQKALNKVKSTLHFNRLARILGVKKISYKQDLFSNQYHDKYIKYTQLPDSHLVVRSNQASLFGINGGLPNFILDWLKEAYLKSNRAYLRFIAIFDDVLVKQTVKLDTFNSIVYRAEQCETLQQQETLKQSYFKALSEHYTGLNMLPATLIVRAEGNSLANLKLLLAYYFPFEFAINLNTLEKKRIPREARGRLGQCKLGQGAIIGESFMQLGRKLNITVKIDDATFFTELEQQSSAAVDVLSTIKLICNHYVNHEVVVNVEAEYTGSEQSCLALSKDKQHTLLLGVNSNLASQRGTSQRTVRAL
ncbi:type VI secretion system baseplate subunit TssG [Pseudoalteromonas piratica]|uniref:Uncharacterized protein n=1 Tax=Pseudoalteromonas piratica TaxID=1348114 RepID=A0A0A7EG66_9GAMM|nr:type VI secretion system baseplate subunit TssG [Pseudoalteromonas piratica]AIY65051.1 hypothetical protein OM33_07705 [Pseudoalteromonas piratica]